MTVARVSYTRDLMPEKPPCPRTPHASASKRPWSAGRLAGRTTVARVTTRGTKRRTVARAIPQIRIDRTDLDHDVNSRPRHTAFEGLRPSSANTAVATARPPLLHRLVVVSLHSAHLPEQA